MTGVAVWKASEHLSGIGNHRMAIIESLLVMDWRM